MRVGIVNFNIKPYRVGLCVLPLIFYKEKERKSMFDFFIQAEKGLVCNFAFGEDVIAVRRM